jgi:hypothetical protein
MDDRDLFPLGFEDLLLALAAVWIIGLIVACG